MYVQRQAIVRAYLHIKKNTSAKEVPEASRWYMWFRLKDALREIFSYHLAGIGEIQRPWSLKCGLYSTHEYCSREISSHVAFSHGAIL